MCLNSCLGEEISFKDNNYHQRNKDGKLYRFTGCNNCNYDYKCKAKMKKIEIKITELLNEYWIMSC